MEVSLSNSVSNNIGNYETNNYLLLPKGYDFIEVVGKSNKSIVVKCRIINNDINDINDINDNNNDENDQDNDNNNKMVVLKLPVEQYPTRNTINGYKQEFEIAQVMKSSVYVLQYYSFKEFSFTCALIMEDVKGSRDLLSLITDSGVGLHLTEFLHLATQLAEGFVDIHEKRIIHSDVNPRNILITQQRQVKIIDFNLATSTVGYNEIHKRFRGTLSYVSPEQTQRTNLLTVDTRSDLYSLGITFYQMITGSLPFTSLDLIEIIHSHVALHTIPPHKIKPEIPQIISDIIMKLISKNPEDRYQTAFGLLQDLQTYKTHSSSSSDQALLESFELATHDQITEFRMSQKLYGRQDDVKELNHILENVNDTSVRVVFISGYSGVGKTTLLKEIYRVGSFSPFLDKGLQVIRGKYEQFSSDSNPYSGIVQAFQRLIDRILSLEDEETMLQYKSKLEMRLGINAELISRVLPTIELILGNKTLAVSPLINAIDSQNRFNSVFSKLINVFATQETPLILILDDLQWADSSSLQLLTQILTSEKNPHLMLFATIRENEVEDNPGLVSMISKIKPLNISKTITLSSLTLNQVTLCLLDTFKQQNKDQNYNNNIQLLSELVFKKTQGNPYFMNQFMLMLHQELLIHFNKSTMKWEWDLKIIESQVNITDNIVDLLTHKISKLSSEVRRVLSMCAMIGSRFSLNEAALTCDLSVNEARKWLNSAINEGFLMSLSEESYSAEVKNHDCIYQFTHDKLQQAATTLIPERSKAEIHLKIGRIGLASLLGHSNNNDINNSEANDNKSQIRGNAIYDVVRQLDKGAEGIKDDKEMLLVLELNLRAIEQALSSAAITLALEYARVGFTLLNNHYGIKYPKSETDLSEESKWITNHDLTFNIYKKYLECLYLNGDYQATEELYPLLLSKAKTNAAKIEIYLIQSKQWECQYKFAQSLQSLIDALQLSGVDLPSDPEKLAVLAKQEIELIFTNLKGNPISSISSLGFMEDETLIITTTLLHEMTSLAYITGNRTLYAVLGFKIINYTILHGICISTCQACAIYSLEANAFTSEYNTSKKFVQVALDIFHRTKNRNPQNHENNPNSDPNINTNSINKSFLSNSWSSGLSGAAYLTLGGSGYSFLSVAQRTQVLIQGFEVGANHGQFNTYSAYCAAFLKNQSLFIRNSIL